MTGFIRGGLVLYAFGAYFTTLIKEFGWSRASLSGVSSLARLDASLLAPIEGYFVDRLGPRKLMLFGFTLCGIGFMVLSRVNSLIVFYIVFVLLVSTGSAFASFIAPQTAVAHWFIKKRGRAFGIQLAGFGMGGVLVPVVAWLIAQYGWRTAFEVSGFAMWIVGIPMALIIRHKPEQYGYLPDGEIIEEPVNKQEKRVTKVAPLEADFTARQALKTKAFWLIALTFLLALMATDAVAVHLAPHLESRGFSPQLAATALGFMALVSIIGRLGFGWLGDMLDKRHALAICLTLQCIGLLILANTTSLWHVFLYLAIFSPGYGGLRPLSFAIRAEYFGRRAFGTIAGLTQLITMFGTITGPVFAGWMFDTTGSYHLSFTLLGLANIAGIALILMLKRPALAPESGNQPINPI